ncbi:hypothetical protein MTYP_01668 [Methylophilaceae bacterium]|nr:hypothetical protein MTYP_01668 [Methylophilaceae bacterium]
MKTSFLKCQERVHGRQKFLCSIFMALVGTHSANQDSVTSLLHGHHSAYSNQELIAKWPKFRILRMR